MNDLTTLISGNVIKMIKKNRGILEPSAVTFVRQIFPKSSSNTFEKQENILKFNS